MKNKAVKCVKPWPNTLLVRQKKNYGGQQEERHGVVQHVINLTCIRSN